MSFAEKYRIRNRRSLRRVTTADVDLDHLMAVRKFKESYQRLTDHPITEEEWEKLLPTFGIRRPWR